MRGLLTPLEKLAQDHGAAVLLVSHLNKNASGDPVGRVMGSLAFVAAARGAFVVVSDPENPARRLFLPLKNNLGTDQTGLAFSVGSKQITGPGGATITTSHIEWESGPITLTAREALQPESGREQGEDLVEAKNFLLALLADGAVSSKQVQADAAGAGHSWRTIQRAQKSLGIVAYKTGLKQGWAWRLPPKEASLKSKYSSKTASGSTPSNPLEDHEGCQPGSKTATVLGQEAAGGLHGGLQEQDELPETDAAELEVFNL
jgi:putative DNA primase/helicase